MELKNLNRRPNFEADEKLKRLFRQFEKLINTLTQRDLPQDLVNSINQDLEQINAYEGDSRDFKKLLKKKQSNVLRLLEKQLKLVPISHYQTTWMTLGMAVFGIPFGTAFGAALDNMGLLGLGIPLGMVIGMALGAGMDKKAKEEGRQLDLQIKY